MKNSPSLRSTGDAHLPNASAIIEALLAGPSPAVPIDPLHPVQPLLPYQRHLFAGRFGDIIARPSFAFISKTPGSWLVVGDRRPEVASDIRWIIERHGLGVGLLVLHLQQLRARHILTEIRDDDGVHDLTVPTDCLRGAKGELVLSVPLRRYRADFERLAALSIAKPRALWDPARIVTHERDRQPCFYCSCAEINPAEVVVDIEGPRHGLSRSYELGFTFAPFGNPIRTVHFLAWDRAPRPLNMSRCPITVSDLVKLTREINLSIRAYGAEMRVGRGPVLDGLSNGWAGNSIYHQHFQFFHPEHPAPITQAPPIGGHPIIQRDDVIVERLAWPCPVYRIRAAEALNTGLVGNDLAGVWQLLGGGRRVPYKPVAPGRAPEEIEHVPVHTQNLYVPGRECGATVYLVLRDRERVDYRPGPADRVGAAADRLARPKLNLGVLEATGTLIMDDREGFEAMRAWEPAEVSRQMELMLAAIAPDRAKVAEFETAIRDLFPV